jgi:hypothetical protein
MSHVLKGRLPERQPRFRFHVSYSIMFEPYPAIMRDTFRTGYRLTIHCCGDDDACGGRQWRFDQ